MSSQHNPPRLAERFFHWFCHNAHLEGLEGDLYEMFDRNVELVGLRKAKIIYIKDIITLLRSTVAKPMKFNSKLNAMDMYKNYLLTAARMGWKRKGFSLINLMGLTLGISSVIYISLFVVDELKYDKHIGDLENKYRAYNIYHNSSGSIKNMALVPPMFAPEFKSNFPQVEKAGRIFFDYGGTTFQVDESMFAEENGFFAEKEALEILDIRMKSGNLESLRDIHSILLSESTFRRFFGDSPFDEQTVTIGNETTLKVGGVFEDIPRQAHIKPGYFRSFEYIKREAGEERMNSWRWQQFYTYFELTPGTNISEFAANIRSFTEETAWPITQPIGFYYEPAFQNIGDIHLHSGTMDWEVAELGSYQSVAFLSISAFIILLIASLNFVNLTSAQALKRAKEVVVRKFIGANRAQLITQYAIESLLYTILAGFLSLALVVLLLPWFNQLADKQYTITEVFNPLNLGVFALFVSLLGIVSGVYPALLLTSFQPLDVMHGSPTFGNKRNGGKIDLKQAMVGLQYVLSIGLVLVSLIMQRQYSYLQNTDMGFNKENLLVIPLTSNMKSNIEQVKKVFSDHSNIERVTACYGVPGGMVAGDRITVPDLDNKEQTIGAFMIDEDYLPTMDMRLVAGRNFSSDTRSDELQSFIINETAVRNFGFGSPEEAIGRPLHWGMWNEADTLKKGRVIGVVEDFNYKSLHSAVESAVLQIDRRVFQFLVLKIGDGDLSSTIAFLEEQYKSLEANRLFEFDFVDKTFQQFYESEQRTSQMFTIFTILAIFTAAIGLFGLVNFSIVSRGKEIGIRKVLGANTRSIFLLLVQKYFVLAIISLAIALPIAYNFASGWLDNFAYRTKVGVDIFLVVAVVTIAMTILTVGYQAYKGASLNPSDKLRSE
ncbi:MAG: FtsX-like permease family protein [Imperialibacter sp.]|uniref:FtsX-like permease family protein n=1 Tax=Imperialibacter sp. TaxID=2038411 RepID=UPI0032EDF6E1